MRHLQGIKCVIRQFLASQDLIVDMIFEWLEFLVEIQTEKKTQKVPQKTEKKPKKKPKNQKKTEKNEKNRTLPQISNLGLFFSGFFFGFFWVATPQSFSIKISCSERLSYDVSSKVGSDNGDRNNAGTKIWGFLRALN